MRADTFLSLLRLVKSCTMWFSRNVVCAAARRMAISVSTLSADPLNVSKRAWDECLLAKVISAVHHILNSVSSVVLLTVIARPGGEMGLTIPDNIVEKASAPDLLEPLQTLLQGINLLGKKTADTYGDEDDPNNDPGAQVLETSATAVGKIVAPVLAGLGGLTAIGTAIGSFVSTSHDSVRIAALASAAGFLVAIVLGFSYIVSADLKSRSGGTVAMYEARKAITLRFLQEVVTASQAPQAQADANNGSSSTPAVPPTPAAAIVALAAAGAKAQILHKADQKVGHLAGICCDDKVSVRWIDADGNGTWSDLDDIRVMSYTF